MSQQRTIAYRLLTASSSQSLDEKVAKHLAEGFEPYGNPIVAVNEGKPCVGQAVVKKTDAWRANR